MITYIDILVAVNKKITINFPQIQLDTAQTSNIDIQASDIKNKLIRPSFRTTLDGIKSRNFLNDAIDRDMTVRVYYFPKSRDKYKIELLEVQAQLEQIFLVDNNQLKIKKDEHHVYTAEIDEIEIDTIDGVLHFYFDLQIIDTINRIDMYENMEDLNIITDLNN